MSKLPQIGDDIAARFRDLERRVAEAEARSHDLPTVRAVWSANTPVPSNGATVTPIAFGGTDLYDTDEMHDEVTLNTRLTFRVDGVLSVGGYYQMAAGDGTGYRGIYLRVNGVTFIDQFEQVTATFGGAPRDLLPIGDTDFNFAANDYVELVARQINNAGATLNVTGGAFWATFRTRVKEQ